ncbi:MAG: hypothetical protein QOK28_1438 [Actinomycetota bacterium]|jgi:hypothetical protein
MKLRKIAVAALIGMATIVSTAGVASARQGADDPAGHVRHGHRADDGANHQRGGADDGLNHR